MKIAIFKTKFYYCSHLKHRVIVSSEKKEENFGMVSKIFFVYLFKNLCVSESPENLLNNRLSEKFKS